MKLSAIVSIVVRNKTIDSSHHYTEWNNDLIKKCRLKKSKLLIYELTFSIIAQTADKIQRNYIFAYVSIWFALT